MWYPGVPAPNLFVNEASFIGEHPLTTSYQPLCYIDFGGPNGVYLRSLTEIRVFANIDILEIDFLYETNAAQPIQPQKLGRTERNFSPASAQIFFSPGAAQAFSSSASVQTFSIDGPGGEIIQHVEVIVIRTERNDAYSFERHGKLKSFKVGHPPPLILVLLRSNL